MKIPKAILWILLVALIAGLAYGAVLLRHGISARKDPSKTETRVARALRHMAIPKLDREDENPWKDVATPDVMKDAREHFADHCAQCHANDGSGQTSVGRNLYPPAPDMRAARTQALTDGALFYAIEHGIPWTGMAACVGAAAAAADAIAPMLIVISRAAGLGGTSREHGRRRPGSPGSRAAR